ncbi:MIP family channel protein [Enterococcus sp. BWB1-3]|uniref:MIP family channel protein n=1 Tax=unclassified Enterococcus TaxID=2608891 RepID=UPI001920475B|nr:MULTISPECIES: MIP family channel protein [unclassified Enterococcus]MBL1230109.1 MIP family channel protein [Enterococcus sp. BWB1-3]MCB5950988.1 MIP family channel protein [Enterococcus sp. BWT-B8]MCB5955182.1 MIP family channel protein [Enterococcus sp. CWB-B31]
MKKAIAEIIGTFILVFFGTATAVLGNGMEGIGTTGIALAFGLTIIAAAYSIGTISGAHLNPAVSLGMWVNKRITTVELAYYIVGQVIGALLASFSLLMILEAGSLNTSNLGQNGFGDFTAMGALVIEIILTFIFVLVIMTVTSAKKGNAKLAGIVIGLTLTMVHLVGIPLTGTSVNPARSLGPAIFAGGDALSQLWVFIVAPLIGGLLAALVAKYVLDTEEV